jgi:hypothetical protein
MTIRNKTRKILWSKSGNRCAFCKKHLVQKVEVNNSNFILGEECHIISSKENGPRGSVRKLNDYDLDDNLILLCANDHKLIDDFPETYTYETLVIIKENHEKWIESAIEKDLQNYIQTINNIEKLDEIINHVELDIIIKNSHFYFFDSSSITDQQLSIEVSELFDNLRDLSDLYSDIEIADKTRYLIQFENEIKRLNKFGLRIFGKSLIREYKFLNIPKDQYKIAMIVAFNSQINPDSIQDGQLLVKIPNDFSPTL